MDSKDLSAEVRSFVEDALKAERPVAISWAAHEIIGTHDDIAGSDVPFYQICAYGHVRELVKKAVNKYAGAPETEDRQLILSGFEHLQIAYPMARNGEQTLVPVSQCTDAEMLARADELDAMAVGCRTHAKEIRDYLKSRRLSA